MANSLSLTSTTCISVFTGEEFREYLEFSIARQPAAVLRSSVSPGHEDVTQPSCNVVSQKPLNAMIHAQKQ